VAPNILLIDSDIARAESLVAALSYEGYRTVRCSSYGAMPFPPGNEQPDLVIFNAVHLGMNQAEAVVEQMRHELRIRSMPVISFVTEHVNLGEGVAESDHSATVALHMLFDLYDLIRLIERALDATQDVVRRPHRLSRRYTAIALNIFVTDGSQQRTCHKEHLAPTVSH